MAYDQRNLDDYIDVAERIQEFYDRYPEGSLQPADPAHPWEQALMTGRDKDGSEAAQTYVVYTAAAYRTPDDTRPGIGIAWEIWPGRTPYTRGSEVMNAETSAWGRAIAALGIATKKGIASRQEVANRRQEREDGLPTNADGSLSRSRTTDAQKDAAGVMTAAQHAEHTELGGGHPGERKMPREERAKVTRIKPEAPPADDWQTTSDSRGTIAAVPRLRTAVLSLCSALGKRSHADRVALLSELTGREITSTDDLSITEGLAVEAELRLRKAADK